jgi:protocatechuate 4,5-dioxygenase, alpha chain
MPHVHYCRLPGSGRLEAAIPGTTLFDGAQARKGYALNKMCYSFNEAPTAPPSWPTRTPTARVRAERRAARGHPRAQRAAADRRRRQRLLPGQVRRHLRLDVQDIGAQQTGMTKDEFKAMLVAARG